MPIKGMSVVNASTVHKNIFLVGFMGTGKSAVGRGVARRLKFRFFDVDREIELAAGRSISEIFSEEGEAAFRELERNFIELGLPEAGGCVVSCGGGLITQPGMPELLKSKGMVISLFASVETICERTGRNDRRPLLQCDDPEAKVRELLNQRFPDYCKSYASVSTDKRPVREVVDHICRIYRAAVSKEQLNLEAFSPRSR